jgi:cholesterol transport system auxiliary component
MNHYRRLASIVMLSFLPLICGCGLGGGPPPRQYTVAAATGFTPGAKPVSWSLAVDEPTAPRQIDSSRIALMNSAFQVEYYAGVEWTDNAPAMVQLLLIQSFENSGRLPVVASSRRTMTTDFLLLSNLQKFQVEKHSAGKPEATVVLEATLLRTPRREPVATARFESMTPVADASAGAVTTAFNASLGDVMRQAVGWTLTQGSAAAQRRDAVASQDPRSAARLASGRRLDRY